MYDVAIIGGGITGTSIARELSKYNVKTVLLEERDDVAMGATKANSAIVHGGYAEAHAKLKGRLCYQGRRQFQKLDNELHFGFDPIGSLVLAFDEDQKAELEKLLANGKLNGLDDISIIEHDQIVAMEPNVNPDVKYALYCKGAGVCSPYEMAIAMMENAIHNGARLFLEAPVIAIDKTDNGFEITSTNERVFPARFVINCAGVSADKVSALAGDDSFTIHPRSGEYMLMVRGSGSAFNTVLFQMPTKMGKGILITPTYHGNLLLGPDAVDEDFADRDTHAERLLKIYKEALLTSEKINIKQFIRSFTGVRPVSSTDDFIIKESEKVPGFINVAGIQSPGLTSSPAIAQMVVHELLPKAGLVLTENPDFDPNRKPIITRKILEPMNEAMKKVELPLSDPNCYICRCEQVSRATIDDALSREIPVTTFDGIKRRTRAGMGWCQGTFCRARVAAVLSEKLGYQVNPGFDIEHSGVNRVGKEEIVEYIESHLKD
ncbi:MAG: NAD(P)/FAD-dependent oxidoreductase [Eubacteriaceae bacterium]|jgi:glycerol-3-phosphate dehydrogenase